MLLCPAVLLSYQSWSPACTHDLLVATPLPLRLLSILIQGMVAIYCTLLSTTDVSATYIIHAALRLRKALFHLFLHRY